MMLEQLHYFVLNYVDIITRDTLALWLTYCTSNSAHNNRVDTIYGLPGLSLWGIKCNYLSVPFECGIIQPLYLQVLLFRPYSISRMPT